MALPTSRYAAYSPWLLSTVTVLAVTQYVFVYVSASVGILLTLIVLIGIYTLLSALAREQNHTEVVEDISLLFIYVLLESALPWFFLNQNLLIPGVYTIVIGLAFWRISFKNVTLSELGFVRTKVASYSLVGLLIGIPTGIVEFLVLRPLPATPTFSYTYLIQTAGYMLFFVALGEELLFRGLIQRSLIKMAGPRAGIFWAAIIFSIMHTVWRSVPELIFTFCAGLLLGVFYYKTRSLAGPIALHAANNIVLLAVMPYLLF